VSLHFVKEKNNVSISKDKNEGIIENLENT
jgi:hypothetical protein